MTLSTPEELARNAWKAMPRTATVNGEYCIKQEWPDDQPNDERVLFAESIQRQTLEALIADAEAAGDNDNVLCFYDDQDGQFHPESPSTLADYLRQYLIGGNQ